MALNGLSCRAASRVTGLGHPRLTRTELAGEYKPNRETTRKLARLGLPHDLLELRSGRLPDWAEEDIAVQDDLYRFLCRRRASNKN